MASTASMAASGSYSFSGAIDFDSIPRHVPGYVKIPRYVFENCNQQVCHSYDESSLEEMRHEVQQISDERIEEERQKCDPETLIKRGEEVDWVYGLDYLERTYLSDPTFSQRESFFTTDEIIHINGLLSRFSNADAGKFRRRSIYWNKRDLSISETIVRDLFYLKFIARYTISSLRNEETEDALFACLSNPNDKSRFTFDIAESVVKAQINLPTVDQTGQPVSADQLDLDIAGKLVRSYPGSTEGTINVVKWLKDYMHCFPAAKSVQAELQGSLDLISSDKMHPIEKACFIWFEIVRIHISHEAHKRTGKAIGSVILLAHGYPPPEISGADGARYVKLLVERVGQKDGHIPFTHFIVEMMQKTYAKYASIPGYLEKYQA